MRYPFRTIITVFFLCLSAFRLSAREVIVVSNKESIESQVTRSDVEYIIRIPFDLNGDRLVVPENCILRFQKKGCLMNGILVGFNTEVVSKKYKILNNIALEGTFITKQAVPEWFTDENDDVRIEKAIQIADVVVLNKKYKACQTIYINSPTILRGKGLIDWGEAKIVGISINSHHVTLEGLSLKTTAKKADLLHAIGSKEKPLTHIRIEKCSLQGGMIAIRWDYVEESLVSHNQLHNVEHTGVGLYSCHNVDVAFNHIKDINLEHNNNNSYGIAASFHYGDPKSTNIRINDNIVDNNPYWEALDTHGGENIEFCRNVIRNCWRGVAAVSDNHRNHEICSSIVIADNVIECSAEPRSNGIVFTGLDEASMADGWTITGNVIKNAVIGFYSNYTSGAVVANNYASVMDEGWRDRSSVCLSFSNNSISIVGEGESQYRRCGLFLIPATFVKNPFGIVKNNHIIAKDNIGVIASGPFKNSIVLSNNTIETRDAKYKGGDDQSTALRLNYFTEIK